MGKVPVACREYADYVKAIKVNYPVLAREIGGFHGIGNVLDWMNQRTFSTIDMIGQDEFEYDFMVQMKPDQNWLVFGVT